MLPISGVHTTMIGSMPHSSAEEALDALGRFPLSIPVWPQLPKRGFVEGMVPQCSEGFPGIKIDEDAKKEWLEQNESLPEKMAAFFEAVVAGDTNACGISAHYAQGLYAFRDKLAQTKTKYPLVKGQVTGPFTFGLSLADRDGKACWFDPQYREVVVNGLTQKARWQADFLRDLGDNILISFDEPIFSALGTPAYMGISDDDVVSVLNEVAGPLQERGVSVGLHCCGNMDWSLLARSSIDVISFDAYSFGEKVALYPDAIGEFLGRGGTLAWGIVPTDDDERLRNESVESLKKRLSGLFDLFESKGISRQTLQERLLLTPSCGAGSLTVESAERVLELLGELGKGV